MRAASLAVALVLLTLPADAAQQRGRSGRGGGAQAGQVAFAISVTDPSGAAISNVEVIVEGPAERKTRTEGNRIALENLPAGTYRFRFERTGFVTLERELTARPGKPIEVNVTLTPVPEPAAPPEAEPDTPTVDARPMAADIPALVEKEFVGRAPSRVSELACGTASTSTLIQLRQPLVTHAHEAADEVFYVVGGEGNADVGTGKQRLKAGMFLFVPRGMTHALTPSGRNPLIVTSTRVGEGCSK